MGSRIIHLAVAKQVSIQIQVQEHRFNLGNLLPDAHMGNSSSKGKSHFSFSEATFGREKYLDTDRFLKKYGALLGNDLYLGYYCHLITDEYWLKNIYEKYMIDDNKMIRKELQESYYRDYGKLNKIIIERYNLKENVQYEHISIDEVERHVVRNILSELTYDFKSEIDDLHLELFDEEEIISFIEKASDMFVETIKKRESI